MYNICCSFEPTDLWLYTSTYREQPNVHFLNQWIIQVTSSNDAFTRSWSTFTRYNHLLGPDNQAIPFVKVGYLFIIILIYTGLLIPVS